MKVLLSWLRELVDFEQGALEIARGLTMQGTEAEGFFHLKDRPAHLVHSPYLFQAFLGPRDHGSKFIKRKLTAIPAAAGLPSQQACP